MLDHSHVSGEAEKLPQRLLDATRGTKPGWGSIGVVTLDPHERSIGDRLGADGVVGTEVAVAGAL
jgi:hypothetical protein